jgi:prepilin-type N-terminal cleavage/methylation domain-containing protein
MRKNESGFTLIELMIGMVMAGIVGGVIYSAYNIQTRIYTEQDKTAEMQQNIRAGMSYLQREVRMAGYNSKDTTDATCGGTKKKPGFHTATATTLGFSMDLDRDGKCDDSGENVTYSIFVADGIKKFGRIDPDPKNNKPVAENIVEIDFVYLLEKNSTKTQTRTPTDLEDIVAVQVSMLAQSRTEDRDAKVKSSFNLAIPDWGATPVAAKKWEFTDSNRYRLLTTTINCRNLGLL